MLPSSLVPERLELFRKKLLDTARRNRLVNFRSHTLKGNKPLEKVVVVHGEDPVKVVATLVEPRTMSFIGVPDPKKSSEAGEGDAEFEVVVDYEDEVDQDDEKLNTKLTRSRLDRHLTKIRRDQIEMLEEQGINALFLAVGMLEWYEADHSQEKRRAPLLLVPVVLERTERGGFKLKWDGGEVGSNLSLGALLKEEFAIDLPPLASEELNVAGYFDQVAEAIERQPAWRVDRDAIVLAFFSFAKYLIYKDLAPASWPEDRSILEHPLLDSLLESGFGEPEGSLPEETFLDDHRPVGETNEVFDADGSQTLAILQALSGHSMVVEGPPGTGKSQTIANLIAEFVAEGKKVLFVSEKSAALNVVYDRLKDAGLTGACLELHGTKSNKRSFYNNLRETIEQAQPRLADAQAQLQKLASHRIELNRYVSDLHEPLDSCKVSPREALERLVRLGTEPDIDGRVAADPMRDWTRRDYASASDIVEFLRLQLVRIGLPVKHPFFGSLRSYISPDDKADLARTIAAARDAYVQFEAATQQLTERLFLEVPTTVDGVERLEQCVAFVLASPECSSVGFENESWLTRPAELKEAVEKDRQAAQLKSDKESLISEAGWKADLSDIEAKLRAPGDVSIPHDAVRAWTAIDSAEVAAREVENIAEQISRILSVKQPASIWAMEPHANLAKRMGAAPDCRGLAVGSEKWHTEAESIRELLRCSRQAAALRGSYAGELTSAAWSQNVDPILEVFDRDGSNWWRRLFGSEYRACKRRALGFMTNPKKGSTHLLACLHAIRDVQVAERIVKERAPLAHELLQDRWRGAESAFDQLEACQVFLTQVRADIQAGSLPADIGRVLSQPTALAPLASLGDSLRSASAQCVLALNGMQAALAEIGGNDAPALSGDPRERGYRFLLDQIGGARRAIDALLTPEGKQLNWQGRVDCLMVISEVSRLDQCVGVLEATAVECLSDHWRSRSADRNGLQILVAWVTEFLRQVNVGELPAGLVQFFQNRKSRNGLAVEIEHLRRLRQSYSGFVDAVAEKAELAGGSEGFLDQPLETQQQRIDAWLSNVDELEDYYRYNALAKQCAELGLKDIVRLAESWQPAKERLSNELERAWFNLVMEQAMTERPILREFDRQSHEEMVESFRALDKVLIQQNRAKVAAAHWRAVPRTSSVGEIGFIRLQMNRQRGHRPIRVAMTEAPHAAQAVKPVFMMSPMSVAMYLPPEGPKFDVAIFDEASQIKPEDALGSVVRADQIIVVGDTKQMPPTSFFDRITASDEGDADEEIDAESAALGEQESILALASARIPEGSASRRDLRWHYRSRHEDLIRTSNRLFYKDRLVIFPHPQQGDSEMGVVFRHLPDTIYGRGGSRKNELEAKVVASAALQHVREWPILSLGIVAFSKAQQEAIEDQLDLLRKSDLALQQFDERHGLDRLFVKNLESVQGDERDVIFISVGYGRDENGFLGMSFGPVNREGGERRLNVLITRAKVRTVVYSNFKAGDMRMAETRSEGVHALHTFLAFAESGHLDVVPSVLRLEPSYFEECVFEQLRNRGYDVDKQVGSEGFYIDLAVRHPEHPGRYVLGIECDGAMYHSAKCARDRDRLRQQVLEERGWRIHRVWSTDWWRHPDRELNRCCEAIENANCSGQLGSASPNTYIDFATLEADQLPGANGEVEDEVEVGNEGIGIPASSKRAPDYVEASLAWPGWRELLEVWSSTLADYVKQVVDVEAPVHVDEVIRRIREAAGKGRSGRLIREHLEEAIEAAVERGFVEVRGDFAYRPEQSDFVVRSRSALQQQVKRIELIAPEEIELAAVEIIREAVAVESSDLAKPVGYRLGFARVTGEMEDHINSVIDEAASAKRFSLALGKLRLP